MLGCETGELAYELAKRSDLMVYAVTDDPRKLAAIQKRLDRTGLLGARICVEQWPLDKVPYSDYFANLIVSETAVLRGVLPPSPAEALRMLKPCGGVAMLGPSVSRAPGSKRQGGLDLEPWLAQANLPEARLVETSGSWPAIVRGPLPGAGSWTHEYATPSNTACGDDQLIKSPLGILWFGDPGPAKMVNRHERAASPLAMDGRLFIQGENVVMAYDAYNGVQLWERPIVGAKRANSSHDGSNLALDREGLFVAVKDKCLRLTPASGETAKTYDMPVSNLGKRDRWGYIARSADLLYGSRSRGGTSSDSLFALDVSTGEPGCKASRSPHLHRHRRPGLPDRQRPDRLGPLETARQEPTSARRRGVVRVGQGEGRPRALASRDARRAYGGCPGRPDRQGALERTARPDPVRRRQPGGDVQPWRVGGVWRVSGRPLLATVLRRGVRLAARGGHVRRGRKGALVAAGRIPRAPADRRRHAARRTVGLRSPHGRAEDADSSGDRIDRPLAIRAAGPPLRLPLCCAQCPVLPLALPGVLRPGGRLGHVPLRRPASGLLDQLHPGRRTPAGARGQLRLHVSVPQHVYGRVSADPEAEGLRVVQRPRRDDPRASARAQSGRPGTAKTRPQSLVAIRGLAAPWCFR